MKAGTMQLLKVQARQKFQLPTTWNPSDETIRTRLKKRIHTVNPRKGPKSPVDPSVERTVVEMATAFQKRTGRSMSQSGIIQLVNDLIKGKPILEQEIIDWQLLYCPHIRKRFETTKERPTSANLGPGWYKGFRERNPDFAMVVRNGTTI
ncbi:unnamed protein product [Cylindrotheca closterium]|uniref:Uncharacterized protein n=1 Tax=Cylindrotheca closterium TaxID=2856 RepID=A0AAD2G833_9STRA|nr:unnamed protein product [Cylindrotheca closterium]